MKQREGVELDSEISAEALRDLIRPMKAMIQDVTGRAFPVQSARSTAHGN